MSLTLSSDDLRRLESLTRLLARPLDGLDSDAWRSEVLREIKALLGAESAGFHLPVADGEEFYTEDFGKGELDSRPYVPPPPLPDGTCMIRRGIDLGVSTLERAYGAAGALYRSSEFYNEYARPLGKAEILFASVGWGARDAGSAGSIQLHRGEGRETCFGEREVALLRLLYPALVAGVDAWRRWDRWRRDLLAMLDATGQAAAVFAADGTLLHRTPELTALAETDPEGERLLARTRWVASALTSSTSPILPSPAERIETEAARYALRASTYDGEANAPALAVVAIERLTPAIRDAAELKTRYGLTPAESRVAALLALGRTNAEVARTLVISPHTARRHTERVLSKLGVGSRAEVGLRVLR